LIIVHAQLKEDLEKSFLKELNETHKQTSDLLREILQEHYEIKDNLFLWLSKKPLFQKITLNIAESNAKIEAAKARIAEAEKMAEIKAKQKRDAARERALLNQPKVDYGGCEGGAVGACGVAVACVCVSLTIF